MTTEQKQRIEDIKNRLRIANYPDNQLRKDVGWLVWLVERITEKGSHGKSEQSTQA